MTTISLVDKKRQDTINLLNNAKLIAKMKKAQFDAYVGEGFTREQAIQLCK